MLQGVREIFELIDAPKSEETGSKEGKIIFIGRVGSVDFATSFSKAIA